MFGVQFLLFFIAFDFYFAYTIKTKLSQISENLLDQFSQGILIGSIK